VERKQVEGVLSSVCLFCLLIRLFRDPLPIFRLLFVAFRPAGRLGELDNPGSGCVDGLQLLATGVGGAAGRCPRGLPRGRGRRGAS
jgi:hypothetical protein